MRITRYAATLAALGLVLAGCSSEAGQQAEDDAESSAAVETDVSDDVHHPETALPEEALDLVLADARPRSEYHCETLYRFALRPLAGAVEAALTDRRPLRIARTRLFAMSTSP